MTETRLNVNQSNLLGNVYTFYLNNSNMKDYLLYEIVSPSLSENMIPQITFNKIGERTSPKGKSAPVDDLRNDYKFNHNDIFNYCNKKVKDLGETSYNFVYESLKNLKLENPLEITKMGDTDFPRIEMQKGIDIQRTLLVAIRNSLRWIKYNFIPGNFLDILWTPTTFVKFEICGDDKNIWINPVGAYKTSDSEMKNPLSINVNSLNYPKTKWSREKTKMGEFNSAMRLLELKSFDRTDINK